MDAGNTSANTAGTDSVLQWPDERLLQSAFLLPWPEGHDPSPLLDRMWAVLKAHSGWGLAAIQIGDSSPAIVVRAPGNQKIELINPVLEKRIGRRRVSTEGCLSYNKGLTMVKVLRYPMVTVSGLDRNLRPVRYSAKIQQAAALQHEIDHLYGINIANHPDSVG